MIEPNLIGDTICMGILFPSSIFANKNPKGGALLSIFMGGVKKPDIFDKSDDELKRIATNFLPQARYS